jgi:hypothetical protein
MKTPSKNARALAKIFVVFTAVICFVLIWLIVARITWYDITAVVIALIGGIVIVLSAIFVLQVLTYAAARFIDWAARKV